ncbi:hypothetical protein D9611_011857 [Ephemerocybe angulata]|uniref:Fungal-type protein kinase domain-containing protein n=1 Tax=Ephemerocybe angulata TaxID=980116 RepID=A0A8H5FCB2_9AGAR|nr:hypothetical protein D9611_011857 [Tulosesus angulatus]
MATLQSIQRELDGHITIVEEDWARKLYSKSVSPELIDEIKQSLNVVNGRFFNIPETVDAKSDLYSPLLHILQIIVSTSGNSYSVNHDYSVNRDRVDTREVVDTHGRVLQKWIVDSEFSPDIVIQATGNSFELPRTCYMSPGDDDSVGYTNITTAVDLGLDSETGDEDVDIFEQVYRMAVYAKEMYLQQPNRHFVRVLFMTETRLRLIEFNRGGVITTRFINYHDDPDTLIRLIIGLSSPNEETIGMDITIRWREENGRKIPDVICVMHYESGQNRKYWMQSVDPVRQTDNLVHRDKRLWEVKDDEGNHLLIKDSWVGAHGTPEYTNLSMAIGLHGVQQLVDYEDRTGEPYGDIYFLSDEFMGVNWTNHDMVFQRIVTVQYGDSMYDFDGERETLAAICDAIAAHQRLLERGILHGDISLGNILFGGPHAPEDLRGVLIDLDVAVEAQFDENPIGHGFSGTFPCISLLQLHGKGRRFKVAHDYFDDLESFFWVLIQIIYDHDFYDEQPWAKEFFYHCRREDAVQAAGAKRAFLAHKLEKSDMPMWWSEECRELVIGFQAFVNAVVTDKEAIVGDMTEMWDVEALRKMRTRREEHYGCVLGMFDVVLSALE